MEALAPDEMRVIACGTGMPIPRLKQAAACFLVELGNGDKFIFDMGEGSFERLNALEMPLDQLAQSAEVDLLAPAVGDPVPPVDEDSVNAAADLLAAAKAPMIVVGGFVFAVGIGLSLLLVVGDLWRPMKRT